MWKNLKQRIYHTQVLAPQTFEATAATASVDTQDINSLGFILSVGAMAFTGVNYLTVNIEESDDNTNWTSVTETYEGIAPAALILNATGQQSMSHIVEYRGGMRYARLNIVESGTVSVPLSVVAISNKPELMPPQ